MQRSSGRVVSFSVGRALVECLGIEWGRFLCCVCCLILNRPVCVCVLLVRASEANE